MKTLVLIGAALLAAGTGPVRAVEGEEIFQENCAKCHGRDGKGKTKMAQEVGLKVDFTDAQLHAKLKDEDVIKAIKEGIKDKETGKKKMRAFDDLSEEDVKTLLAYVRAFKK